VVLVIHLQHHHHKETPVLRVLPEYEMVAAVAQAVLVSPVLPVVLLENLLGGMAAPAVLVVLGHLMELRMLAEAVALVVMTREHRAVVVTVALAAVAPVEITARVVMPLTTAAVAVAEVVITTMLVRVEAVIKVL
jgi:hypothetical protein